LSLLGLNSGAARVTVVGVPVLLLLVAFANRMGKHFSASGETIIVENGGPLKIEMSNHEYFIPLCR
jgi:hypothetical protein